MTVDVGRHMAYINGMTWKTFLNEAEQEEFRKALKARDDKRASFNATRNKLKKRAEQRMTAARKREERTQ